MQSDWNVSAAHQAAKRVVQAGGCKSPREDPVCNLAEIVQRRRCFGSAPLEESCGIGVARLAELCCAQTHAQGQQMLLCTVMHVPLQRSTLVIGAHDDPVTRLAHLFRADRDSGGQPANLEDSHAGPLNAWVTASARINPELW